MNRDLFVVIRPKNHDSRQKSHGSCLFLFVRSGPFSLDLAPRISSISNDVPAPRPRWKNSTKKQFSRATHDLPDSSSPCISPWRLLLFLFNDRLSVVANMLNSRRPSRRFSTVFLSPIGVLTGEKTKWRPNGDSATWYSLWSFSVCGSFSASLPLVIAIIFAFGVVAGTTTLLRRKCGHTAVILQVCAESGEWRKEVEEPREKRKGKQPNKTLVLHYLIPSIWFQHNIG